jgi:4-hydroxythreonine-4-phosphate dehydrogenase
MIPSIVVSLGDPNGIGYEIVLKSLRRPTVRKRAAFTLIGSRQAWNFWQEHLDIRVSVPIIDIGDCRVRPGKVAADAGLIAARAIETAAHWCIAGKADAMVTAPIAKEALHLAGVEFPGHTEMLQAITRSPRVTMILCSPRMRVALATIHTPISFVAALLDRRAIAQQLVDLHRTLSIDFGVAKPRIAVLGLNPHAGEHGMFGTEEARVIEPAIAEAKKKRVHAFGPFPADGFFARWTPNAYDAVLAMYHDQGLIPLKMDAHGAGVNVSASLPIVRTSPDHGTAFDIAGHGTADPVSFITAIELALTIANNRKHNK